MGKFASVEQSFQYSAKTSVLYKRQEAKQDRRHLVVVFSGFCPIGRYNFDGTVADGCRFNILWINDVFHDNNTYYLCHDMDFEVELAVHALIMAELARLDLPMDECTLLGYSKGGSAALFFGMKYGFKNILASAPQMRIGSFAREHFNSAFMHMTKSASYEEEIELDYILPNLLESVQDFNRNVYVISSLSDQFHDSQIVPFLPKFEKFSNFNLIMTDSPLVDEHKIVGAYNTPIILSILYALGEGCVPVFGHVKNGIERVPGLSSLSVPHQAVRKPEEVLVTTMDRVNLVGATLFPEGVAFIRGVEQVAYGKKQVALVLESSAKRYVFELGGSRSKDISGKFFERHFVDYSFAGYKSIASAGVDLSEIDRGRYTASLEVRIDGSIFQVPVTTARNYVLSAAGLADLFTWESNSHEAALCVDAMINVDLQTPYFQLRILESDGTKLYIDGDFAIPFIESGIYSGNRYYLVLIDQLDNPHVYPLAQGNRPEVASIFGVKSNQSKSRFTTPEYQGMFLPDLADGIYSCFVTFVHEGTAQSVDLKRGIRQQHGYIRIC